MGRRHFASRYVAAGMLAALGVGGLVPPVAADAVADALAPTKAVPAVARELTGVTGLTEPQLRQYRDMLGSADAETRKRAIDALSHLTADSLPAIEQRLLRRRRERIDYEVAEEAMRAFRHAVGSRRADDHVDIAPGIAPVLAAQRDTTTVAMAEVILLLRAIERIQTREAGLLLATVIPMDKKLWRPEMRRVRKRAGLWLLPAMIELRSHDDGQVKAWARYGVRALGMDEPKAALNQADAHLKAMVVRAYARPLDFDAMPLLVRLVDDVHLEVREAARWAVAEFGKNAIWQLRELYEELTGKRANRRWGHERTARELYLVIDREALEAADTRQARGMQHLAAGELEAMRDEFDAVLARFPNHPGRHAMAAGYAALGDARLRADALQAAAAAYRRALRLAAADDDKRAHYGAQLAFIEAELSLTRGVVDLAGYRRALALEADHRLAADALSRLTGQRLRERLQRRRLAAAAAMLLLGLFIYLLWRRPAASSEPLETETA